MNKLENNTKKPYNFEKWKVIINKTKELFVNFIKCILDKTILSLTKEEAIDIGCNEKNKVFYFR